MITENRHIKLEGQAVISYYAFIPPLIASAIMEGEACFIFPIRAAGQIYRQDGPRTVRKGQGVLMKCGQYINKWNGAAESTDQAEVVIIRFIPDVLRTILKSVPAPTSTEPVQHPPLAAVVDLDKLLLRFLDSLLFYFDYPHLATDELVFLKIKELTLLLMNTAQDNPVKELLFNLFHPEQYTLKQIVEANLFEPLSLDELAALASMSTATFKRKFKQLLGESPGRYIQQQRLAEAAHQLSNTDKTVSAIAYDCGFSDPNYFSKAFSKQFEQSPTQYRHRKP